MRIGFIGDLVGPRAIEWAVTGVTSWRERDQLDLVVANVENACVTGPYPANGFGVTKEVIVELLASGVDACTGGNHSWDGPGHEAALAHRRALRPLNYSPSAPGRGVLVLDSSAGRLAVINIASRSALPMADLPWPAIEHALEEVRGSCDAVLVDFHGESVAEKQALGLLLDGQVAAFLGTHTHVQTADLQVLQGGTAYVTDVGMVGPSGGVQGVQVEAFRRWFTDRLPPPEAYRLAEGSLETGLVVVEVEAGLAAASWRPKPWWR